MAKKDHRRRKSPPRHRESEAALIICAENPEVVARRIAGLTLIANYRLRPKDPEIIHDFYFDTPDRALQTQRLALRIRKMGAEYRLTLKGPSQPTEWGGMERLEMEAPWSHDALTTTVKELMDKQIKVQPPRRDFDPAHPLDVMAGLGLEVVQDRETQRQVRNIVFMGEESGPALAELAIDSVVYHLSGREICLHEVEIEAKRRGGSRALKTVLESLRAMYEPALRRWDHSKLATGQAIERLLSEGALEGLLDINNNLKPVAYDKINDDLKRGRI